MDRETWSGGVSSLRLRINGSEKLVEAHPLKRLLDVLREDLGLTGTKEGCGEGECGACTVLIDGEAVVSCLIPVVQAEGCDVTTIESLRAEHKLQHAFIRHGAAQCGICTPGMIMAALQLPKNASLAQIKMALAGNICRCTGYEAIYRAIQDA